MAKVYNFISLVVLSLSTFIFFVNAKASSTYTIKTEMPSGAIMAFNTGSCPTGWSTFNGARGRVLVGAGAGNNDADGTALTSRTVGSTGGREFTTGIPAVNARALDPVPSPTSQLANAEDMGSMAINMYDISAATTTVGGQKADSNMMPYSNILYCQKD